MKNILLSVIKYIFWLLLPIFISGCVTSLNKQVSINDHIAPISEIAEHIKTSIKKDSRFKIYAWKIYAINYINFVDTILYKEQNKLISSEYARKVLIKSYDLFQSGSYSPNKVKMLYLPEEKAIPDPLKEQPWLPDTPPKM